MRRVPSIHWPLAKGTERHNAVYPNMTLSRFLLSVRPVEVAEALKKILRISYREVQIGSRKFWLDPASNFGSRLLQDQYYEPHLTSLISELLQPGDSFVDLGANEGYFSILASELVGPKGQVYSIEPQARLWTVILKNFLLNDLRNHRLIPYAVGDSKCEIELRLYPSINTGASNSVDHRRTWLRPVQKTKVLPLNVIFEDYGITKVKVLKVDIEGFELTALKSLGDKLNVDVIENIVIEIHHELLHHLGHSAEAVYQLLTSRGYRLISKYDVEHWGR